MEDVELLLEDEEAALEPDVDAPLPADDVPEDAPDHEVNSSWFNTHCSSIIGLPAAVALLTLLDEGGLFLSGTKRWVTSLVIPFLKTAPACSHACSNCERP